MSISKELEIVIPVHDALDYLRPLLLSLEKNYPRVPVVVVDDQSQEPTKSFLRDYVRENGQVSLLVRASRGWFTRSANTGLKHVLDKSLPPEWVVCLNSDCSVELGGLEELIDVWLAAEREKKKSVGLVGAEGQDPSRAPRYSLKQEPQYVTGHAFLLSTKLMKEQNLLFPWKDGQARGFTAQQLIHINSDRALSYEMNRRGMLAVASHWARIGHYGGRSWGCQLHAIPNVKSVGVD